MAKTKKPVDAAAWARSTSRKTGGLMCTLCAAAPAAREAMETIQRLKNAGETTASIRQIQEFIREHFEIEIGQTSLSRHLREHVK